MVSRGSVMKLKTIKTLAIIQAVLLGSYAPLAIAATAKQSPEVAKLDNIEEVIYGAPKASASLDTRLKDLELKLFGITRKGTTTERLAAIEKTLAYGSGAATSGSLLPPLAPTLDTPSSSSSSSNSPSSVAPYTASHDYTDEPYAVDSSGALADAMQLYQDGKVPQAESAFHGILAKDPSNGDAYYNLAVIAEGKNDLNGALSYYRSALNLNPQDTDLQSAVVSVQNKLANSNNAPSHLASSSSSSSSAFSGAPRAAAPAQSKAIDDARKSQLKSAVASASNDYKAGNYDSAVTKLNSVASQVPDDGDVQFALAQAYRAKGDLASARSHMARASSLNPASTTFGSALADIDRAIASKNTLPADSFASSGKQASSQPFSNSQTASQPEGQITPFAGSKAAKLEGTGGGGLNGMAYTARSNSSRLKRAASYGLAGAAAGALSGALFSSSNNGSRMSSAKSNALRGAVLGAVFGFASGK